MTPTVLAVIALPLLVLALLLTFRRFAHRGHSFDLGAVSTGWLAELRRDEPWSRS
jgi:hypothetical protein